MNTPTENPINTQSPAHNYDYPLYGLEMLAHMFFAIANNGSREIDPIAFEKQLEEEISSLQLLLKTQAFALGREKEVRLLVHRYHTSLTQLLDDTLCKKQSQGEMPESAEGLYHRYIAALENMVAFISDYFPEHHDPEQQVPIISLSRQRKELVGKLDKIEQKILSHPEEMAAGELFKRLRRFAASGIPIPFKVRYRDLRYKEELLRHLSEVQWKNEKGAMFTPVEQLLIFLNYNSKAFVRMLIRKIMNDIDRIGEADEKLDTLLRYQKAFRQIHPKPGLVLNPGYHHLGTVLDGWLDEEIRYFEKKLQCPAVSPAKSPEQKKEEKQVIKVLQKILLRLSSDQIGLILRGANDLKILVAKSLSDVFKTIVPHLSTPHNNDLSYKGMRTQSYVAEERDKEVAIETLEQIIKKIKEY